MTLVARQFVGLIAYSTSRLFCLIVAIVVARLSTPAIDLLFSTRKVFISKA